VEWIVKVQSELQIEYAPEGQGILAQGNALGHVPDLPVNRPEGAVESGDHCPYRAAIILGGQPISERLRRPQGRLEL
jgi:hypothetical protein